MRKTLILAVIIAVSGCANVLTEQAAHVAVTKNPADVQNFEYLGTATGSSVYAGAFKAKGYSAAMNEVRDKAAAMGGTHVLLPADSSSEYWSFTGQNVEVKVYRGPVKNGYVGRYPP